MSRAWFCVLLAVACLQLAGIATGSKLLIGLGAASAASPAPKVFTATKGLEAFSSRYFLSYRDRTGRLVRAELDAARYGRLRGPYNRRNAYGAVLAFGPVLASNASTKSMFEASTAHALCGDAKLLDELALPAPGGGPRHLTQMPREGTRSALPLDLEIRCR